MPFVSLAFAMLAAPQSGPVIPPGVPNIVGRPPDHHAPRTTSGSHRAPPPGPADGDDVQVNTFSTADQDETPIRVDPSNRLHLIGGANDDRQGPYECAFYSSADGGLTWSELLFPDPGHFGASGDPAVAIGPNGETYYCALAFGSNSSIYVGQSPDGGITVPNWVQAVPGSSNFEDKQFMCADLTSGALGGALYVSWTRFKNNGTPIMMVSSFDQGQTWSTPVQVSDGNSCQGSCPVVGPNGELYIAWLDTGKDKIRFDFSLDGGVTWHADVQIASINSIGSVPHTGFRANSFPSIDVDRSGGPFHGSLYAVWAEDLGAGNGPDVMLSRSTDGGATWSAKVVASDVATNSQFSPWVAVDPNGNVNVGFLDRRDDANDVSFRYYVSRSSDGGATFLPNVKVADKKTNANKYNQGFFIGDYTGAAASDRAVHGIWTDGRNNDNDVFTSSVNLALFTDVPQISAATGGTANFTINAGPLYQSAGYRVLGSITGTSPGITLNHVNIPLNFDVFMIDTILYANSSALPGFFGTLDATGSAAAALITGPLPPAAVGLQMDFAVFTTVGGRVRWSSDATHLEIVP